MLVLLPACFSAPPGLEQPASHPRGYAAVRGGAGGVENEIGSPTNISDDTDGQLASFVLEVCGDDLGGGIEIDWFRSDDDLYTQFVAGRCQPRRRARPAATARQRAPRRRRHGPPHPLQRVRGQGLFFVEETDLDLAMGFVEIGARW